MTKYSGILITAVTLFSLLPPEVQADDFVWIGAGADNEWSNGQNWEGGVVPSGGGHRYLFNEAGDFVTNNTIITTASQLFFGANAGNYTISGVTIVVSDTNQIVNQSRSTHTFGRINVNGTRTFDTGPGNFIMTQGIGQTGSTDRGFNKTGIGTLELYGANEYRAGIRIEAGRVLYHADSATSLSTALTFGTPALGGNTSIFEITGGNYNVGGNVAVSNRAANFIRLNGGELTLNQFTTSGGGTLNVDASAPGSVVNLAGTPALVNGVITRATYTDGVKTGFATLDTSGGGTRLARFVPTDALPASGATSEGNYVLSGDLTLSENQRIHTLTLTGAAGGTVDGAFRIQPAELLMEEGTGDYILANSQLSDNTDIAIHQHSTSGSLIIDAQIMAQAANSLFKTGAGHLEIRGEGSRYQGQTYLQQGRVTVSGAVSRSTTISIFDGATLDGGGFIGGGIISGDLRRATAVNVMSGGTLAASTSQALGLYGSITLGDHSTFSVELDGLVSDWISVEGTVDINSGVDLLLEITDELFAPGGRIDLLEATGITGTFATINGDAFGPDGRFSLTYGSQIYDLQLFSSGSGIWLEMAQPIPEPSTYALFAGAGAMGWMMRRRRS